MLAESIARIHAENLVNFGVLPLMFGDAQDRQRLGQATNLRISKLHKALRDRPGERDIHLDDDHNALRVRHDLSPRQVDILFAGGAIPWKRQQL